MGQGETDIIVNTRGAVPCETENSLSVGGLSTTREVMLRETVIRLFFGRGGKVGTQGMV